MSLTAGGAAGSDTETKTGFITVNSYPFIGVVPTNQFATFLGNAQIDGTAAEQEDWIAAFDNNGLPLTGYNDPCTVYHFLHTVQDTIPLIAGWNLSAYVAQAPQAPATFFSNLVR